MNPLESTGNSVMRVSSNRRVSEPVDHGSSLVEATEKPARRASFSIPSKYPSKKFQRKVINNESVVWRKLYKDIYKELEVVNDKLGELLLAEQESELLQQQKQFKDMATQTETEASCRAAPDDAYKKLV